MKYLLITLILDDDEELRPNLPNKVMLTIG